MSLKQQVVCLSLTAIVMRMQLGVRSQVMVIMAFLITWDHFCCLELSLTWHFLWKGQHRLNCQVDEISCKNVVKRECLLLSFLLPTTWKMIFKNLSFLSLFPLINKSISSGGCTKSRMFLSSLFNFELNPDRKYF